MEPQPELAVLTDLVDTAVAEIKRRDAKCRKRAMRFFRRRRELVSASTTAKDDEEFAHFAREMREVDEGDSEIEQLIADAKETMKQTCYTGTELDYFDNFGSWLEKAFTAQDDNALNRFSVLIHTRNRIFAVKLARLRIIAETLDITGKAESILHISKLMRDQIKSCKAYMRAYREDNDEINATRLEWMPHACFNCLASLVSTDEYDSPACPWCDTPESDE